MPGQSHGKKFLRTLCGSAGIYAFGTAMGFLAGIQLARGLGLAGYGLYGSAMAAASLGATVASGGLQLHATREVASFRARDEHGAAAHLVKWTMLNVLALGSLAALAVGGYVLLGQEATPSLAVSTMVLTLLMAVLWVIGAIIRGTGAVVKGLALDVAVRPATQSVLLLGGALALGSIEPGLAMALSCLAILLALLLGWPAVTSVWRHNDQAECIAETKRRAWRRASATMGLTTVIRATEATLPLILIGVLSTMEEAGLYRVATAVAILPNMPGSMITVMVPAMVAGLHAQGNLEQLRRLARLSGLSILVPTLAITAVLCIFGGSLLAFAFGEAFRPAATAMAILSVASLIAAMGGISISLLHAARHDATVTRVFGLSLLISIIGVVLVAAQGTATDIALVVCGATVVRTILLVALTWRLVGIDPSILGLRRMAKHRKQ